MSATDDDIAKVLTEIQKLSEQPKRGSWVPYASLVVALITLLGGGAGLVASYGSLTTRVDHLDAEVSIIKAERYATKEDLGAVREALTQHEKKLGHDALVERLDALKSRVDKLESR